MKRDKNLGSLFDWISQQEKTGMLDPGQFEAAEKEAKALQHAVKVRDMWQIQKAINNLARVFLRAKPW